jgi:hypothetical protein
MNSLRLEDTQIQQNKLVCWLTHFTAMDELTYLAVAISYGLKLFVTLVKGRLDNVCF